MIKGMGDERTEKTISTSSDWQDVASTGDLMPQTAILAADSPSYERLRTMFFNDRLPDSRPACIATPTTTAEVSKLIADVKANRGKVGVRSGGHLFPACSLVHEGLLIDTSNLNHTMEYDPVTKIVALGPATTVREAARNLTAIGRFFPFGHHPSVGLCGFLLAGGQGWFMRGWGYTSDTWVEKFEVVMPSSEVITASRYENPDVFYAARGGGQGFFGVVTRIWVKTIPAKSLFHRTVLLDASEDYHPQLKWILKKCDATTKHRVDIAIVTYYSDILDEGDHLETKTDKLVLMVDLTMYADSVEEAATMTSLWDFIDERIVRKVIAQTPPQPISWEQIFENQDTIFPARDRWQCDSVLTNKDVTYNEIANLSEKAMCDLPNRKCVGTICVADYFPDETNQALSLPQRHYIATMNRWKDAAEDTKYNTWMLDAYRPLEKISAGQYIADFDAKHRMTKVMTDSALKQWLSIRAKWDPAEMFIGYRGFGNLLDEHEQYRTAL